MLKRSFLFLRKKQGFSLLCLSLTLLTTVFFAVSILLYRGSHEIERDILMQIGATLHIGPNTSYQIRLQTIHAQEGENYDESSYFPILSKEAEQKILSVDGVLGIEGLNASSIIDALPLNFHNSKQHTGEDPATQDVKGASSMTKEAIDTYTESVNIVGCNNVQLYDYFRRNLCEVIVGDFPSAANPGVLISEQLAKENGLSVGDVIEFHPYSMIMDGNETSGYIEDIAFYDKTSSLQVVGIYSTHLYFDVSSTNIEGPTIYRISPYNTLYTDYGTATSINGKSSDIRFFDIYVDSPDSLDRIMEEISDMDCIDWEKLQITNDTEQFFQQYAGQIKKLLSLTQVMVVVSLVVGSAIFAFVLAVISLDETQDISILLSLGMKKRNIFLQMLTKYLLQSLITLPIAMLLSYCIVTILQVPLMPKLVSSDSSHVLVLFSIGEFDFVPRLEISLELKDILIAFAYEVFLSVLGALLSLYRIIKYNMRQLFIIAK